MTKESVLIQHYNNIARTNFMVISTKLYAPLVTLPVNDNIKLLENIKQGFERIIFWNKYKSEIMTQPKKSNLDYLIDPTFRNINRLFVLSLKNGNGDPTRNSFEKDFNALIDNKLFFDQPVKKNKKHMKHYWNVKKW